MAAEFDKPVIDGKRIEKIPRTWVLWLKREYDPSNWDFDWLAEKFKGNGEEILDGPVEPEWLLLRE